MALRFYKNFKDWDILDKFYKEEIESIGFTFEDESFIRTFCRNCQEKDEKYVPGQKSSKECDCGTKSNKSFLSIIGDDIVDYYYEIEQANKDYTVFLISLSLLTDRVSINLKMSKSILIEIKNDNLVFYDKEKEYFITHKAFNDYNNLDELKLCDFIYTRGHYNLPFESLCGHDIISLLKLRTNNRLFVEDYKFLQYKKISNFLIKKENLINKRTNKTFNQLLDEHDINYPEYFDILDNTDKIITTKDASNKEATISSILKLEHSTNEVKECWSILKHQVENQILKFDSVDEILLLYQKILTNSLDKNDYDYRHKRLDVISDFPDKLDLFKYYIEYNKETYSYNLLDSFINYLYSLYDLGIEINKNNLKPKVLNIAIHQNYLKDSLNINEEKLDLFFDNFESNPLKYLELIKDRKAITKKQRISLNI